jgi:ubiquitin-activating enzyme E1
MCTLKNFPHAIEHCIEWARDTFEGTFADGPKEVEAYIADPTKYLVKLPSEGNVTVQREKCDTIKKALANLKNPSFQQCVQASREMFQEMFYNTPAQLLYNFPLDYKTKEG